MSDSCLMHYGQKGQKWGERQYQNLDGSLTPLGREHYRKMYGGKSSKSNKKASEMTTEELRTSVNRYRLEEQYTSYAKKDYAIAGRERALKVLGGADRASTAAANIVANINKASGNKYADVQRTTTAVSNLLSAANRLAKRNVVTYDKESLASKISAMTDTELLEATERYRLESEYNRYVSRGKTSVDTIFSNLEDVVSAASAVSSIPKNNKTQEKPKGDAKPNDKPSDDKDKDKGDTKPNDKPSDDKDKDKDKDKDNK